MLERQCSEPTLAEKQLLQAARNLMGLPSVPRAGVLAGIVPEAVDDILTGISHGVSEGHCSTYEVLLVMMEVRSIDEMYRESVLGLCPRFSSVV